MKDRVKIVAFDADDTLWVNELNFYAFEMEFKALVERHLSANQASEELFKMEMKNLQLYGYGAKGMMLCMIELICKVVDGQYVAACVSEIIRMRNYILFTPNIKF